MSVAFTKEGDIENAVLDLPDRPVSTHPNLVTAEGLARLEAAFEQARRDYATHQIVEGRDGGDRRALAGAARDLRYFGARLATAQLVPPLTEVGTVRFGALVTIERADGRRQTLRIVGEDEAEPKDGTVSYVSPLAATLMGKGEGDTAIIAGAEVEIIAIAI